MILANAGGGSSFTMILILVVMIALMYFMMIRPQNKERKRLNEMLSAMDIGDAVLTSSGFYGVVIEITGDDVIVEFGNNKNCRIPMKKSAIIQVEKPGGYTAPEPEIKQEKNKARIEADTTPAEVETAQEAAQDAATEAADAAQNAAEAVQETAEKAAEEVSEELAKD